MPLDVAMDAALRGAAPTLFCGLEINLPDHDIRVLDGAGAVSFAGNAFGGSDAVYGALHGVEAVTDQIGTEAPRLRFTFLAKSDAAMAQIANPAAQGSEDAFWLGVVDPMTGLVIGEPELLFVGELDEASVNVGKNSRIVTFDVASAWERLFDANEGARMNDAFQQSMYPGDRAFEGITGVTENLYWGFRAP